MKNRIASTRIALFIIAVIGLQMFSYAQTLSTVRTGTPGSGVWVGNDGLASFAPGKGDNCYRITQNTQNQAGAVWYDHPINFNNPFTISYQAYFGCDTCPDNAQSGFSGNADGADGMAIVFKTNIQNVLGDTGAGIGYEGITNSMAFEFDTFWNPEVNDPLPFPDSPTNAVIFPFLIFRFRLDIVFMRSV